jgi:hypothetical protein
VASKYWIKLYHEILHDPDRLWRRTIELFLMAGEHDDDGCLPSVGDMAWTLRANEGELADELRELAQVDIVAYDDDLQCWVVVHFAERQAPVSSTERVQRFRDREQRKIARGERPVTPTVTPTVTQEKRERNATETIRCTDTDLDTDLDTESEGDQDHGAIAPPSPEPAPVEVVAPKKAKEPLTQGLRHFLPVKASVTWTLSLPLPKIGASASAHRRAMGGARR